MRVISAYLLAVLGGNASPSAADITKILSSVGIEAEADQVKKLLSELEGKNVEDVIKEGRDKLQSVAAVAVPAAGGAAPAAGGAGAAKKEEKAPEPESEEEEMGLDLFG